MKIRNGFVSNSSSSSFVIDASKYTCVDIALQMVKTLELEDDSTNKKKSKERYKTIRKNLKNLVNQNTSIFIECSDDIHIVKSDDKIYVDASYHYEWNLDYIEQGEEGEFSNIIYQGDFYFPLHNNKYLGKLASGDSYPQYKEQWVYSCKNCHCRLIELKDGLVMCPNCKKDPDGNLVQKIFREDKLKRVLKNEN